VVAIKLKNKLLLEYILKNYDIMDVYMNLCKAYRDNSRGYRIGQTIKFSLAISIPIAMTILTFALVHANASEDLVRVSAIFGMVIAVSFLYIISLDLTKEVCQRDENETAKLTTSFIISLFCVICQAILLIYV